MHIILGQSYSFIQLGTRSKQEDARFPNEDKPCKNGNIFIVCDGVGGCVHGDIASQTVCKAIGKYLTQKNIRDIANVIPKALGYAYQKLHNKTMTISSEMATTLAMIVFHQEGCTAVHIGDSRIYHIRPHEGILYSSSDHSLVNSLIHAGIITPEEGLRHPEKNIITRSMHLLHSKNERIKATVMQTQNIENGDYFFLCTDGVSNQFSEKELIRILSEQATDIEKCNKIARISQNSTDNNTAYLIPIAAIEENNQDCAPSTAERNPRTRPCLSSKMITDIDVPISRSFYGQLLRLLNVFR